MSRTRCGRGFTLIEIIIVVLLVAVSMAVVVGINFRQRSDFKLRAAARHTAAFFNTARSAAVMEGVDNLVMYEPKPNAVVDGVRNKTIELPKGIAFVPNYEVEEGQPFPLVLFYSDGSAQAETLRITTGERSMFLRTDPILGRTKVTREEEGDS